MAINKWAVSVLRYGAGIIKWNQKEVQKMDRKTRKIMTMFGALHPKSDVSRIYLPRKKGGRGLIGCEECIRSEENNLGWYVRNSLEPMLICVKLAGVIETENCTSKEEYKRRRVAGNLSQWKEKAMHGQFVREMDKNVDKDETWLWLRKSDLKVGTEALLLFFYCSAKISIYTHKFLTNKLDKII